MARHTPWRRCGIPISSVCAWLMIGMTVDSAQAESHPYWVCRGADGVRIVQDRACPPDQLTLRSPFGFESSQPASPLSQTLTTIRPSAPTSRVPITSSVPAQREAQGASSAVSPVSDSLRFATSGLLLFATLLAVFAVLLNLRRRWSSTRRPASGDRHARGTTAKARNPRVRSTSTANDPTPTSAASVVPTVSPVWSLELLIEMDWKRFEELCELLWVIKGFHAQSTGPGADGGVDVVVAQRGQPDVTFAIVQCKSHVEPVGVKPVRELWGCRDHFSATLAVFYSVSGFHPTATAFAVGKQLKLIDGPDLLAEIRQLPARDQAELLARITRGDYTTPSCPKCEVKLVRHHGKDGRPDFWSCKNFRRCGQQPRPVRRRQGDGPLP